MGLGILHGGGYFVVHGTCLFMIEIGIWYFDVALDHRWRSLNRSRTETAIREPARDAEAKTFPDVLRNY